MGPPLPQCVVQVPLWAHSKPRHGPAAVSVAVFFSKPLFWARRCFSGGFLFYAPFLGPPLFQRVVFQLPQLPQPLHWPVATSARGISAATALSPFHGPAATAVGVPSWAHRCRSVWFKSPCGHTVGGRVLIRSAARLPTSGFGPISGSALF